MALKTPRPELGQLSTVTVPSLWVVNLNPRFLCVLSVTAG